MTKEEMARKTADILSNMLFEDAEFVYKFVVKLARKRGVSND